MSCLHRWALPGLLAWAGASGAQAPATPPPVPPVHVHITEQGDTLIGLSERLLVQPGRWPEIARLNAVRNPRRIPVGTPLRFPLAWLRTEPGPATLLSTTGAVRVDGQPAAPGTELAEGARLASEADGHAVLRLIDGTLLRLRPDSQLQLTESRRVPRTPVTRAGARLQQGRVEVEAPRTRPGQPGFQIDTPQGVLGVRGTEFRVASGPERTRGEVLVGTVAVSGPTGAGAQAVGAGFGSVVNAAGQVSPPVPLLPAPDTAALPRLQERVLMRFPLPALPGATAWRGQVARDAAFQQVLADVLTDVTAPGTELRIADLPDGAYHLRLRGVDAQGLEGRDADLTFTLKARPEPPLPSTPEPAQRLFGTRAEFSWAANTDADRYRLQLATEPGFAQPLRDLPELRGLRTTLEALAPGTYHWRMRSLRADGDAGPWGDAQAFELRPDPPQPKPPVIGDRSVRFAWAGLPGQQFDFQVARDEGFAAPLVDRRLDLTEIEIGRPGNGRFWVRLRAIDPDGFVGPFGAPQYFDVPNCLRDGAGNCARSSGEPVVARP
jgi:hypothetical protein